MILRSLSRERWAVLEPLLDAALELAPARRRAFLEERCGGDAALESELTALLSACDLGDRLLGIPAAIQYAPLLASATPRRRRSWVAANQTGREIGRGGMATIYLADDPLHGREVAVKILQPDVARAIGRGPDTYTT